MTALRAVCVAASLLERKRGPPAAPTMARGLLRSAAAADDDAFDATLPSRSRRARASASREQQRQPSRSNRAGPGLGLSFQAKPCRFGGQTQHERVPTIAPEEASDPLPERSRPRSSKRAHRQSQRNTMRGVYSDEEGGAFQDDDYYDDQDGRSLVDLLQDLARRREVLWAAVVMTCVAAGVLVALTLPARMIGGGGAAAKPGELRCHISQSGAIECDLPNGASYVQGNASSPSPSPKPPLQSPKPPGPPPPPSPPARAPWPPPPPPSPSVPPPGGAVVDRMNSRFRTGRPSNDLDSIGVIMHQFDESEDPDMPWKRCPQFCHGFGQTCGCSFIKDRLAAQTVLHIMPKTNKGEIPLWSEKMGGVVFKGSSIRLFCAFPGECVHWLSPKHQTRKPFPACVLSPTKFETLIGSGGTRARLCDPPGQSDECTPGCTDVYHSWCDGISKADVWCDGDPWKPEMLQIMLEGYRHRAAPWNTHNELVIDAEHSDSQLPGAIEAFWYPLTDGCQTSTKCKAYTERMHAKFLTEYSLTTQDVPIVGLRLKHWEHPFVAVPPAPIRVSSEY